MEEKKNLEIVSDNGSSLDISPAYDYLNATKPKFASEKPTCIVIPKEATKKSKNKKNNHKKNKKREEN